jgi:alpha-tubulin suppressor-like RCC1 family protein
MGVIIGETNSKKIIKLFLGGFHSCSLDEDFTPYCWGSNMF